MKSKILAAIPESEVQANCRAVLESRGCYVERRNTGTFLLEGKDGKTRRFKAGEKGAADLFGVLPDGRHFECEIKRYGKRPTLDQVRFLRRMNRWGPAFWVDDVAALSTFLPEILRGGVVEYLPDEWMFSVELELPGGETTRQWVKERGGDFDIDVSGVK